MQIRETVLVVAGNLREFEAFAREMAFDAERWERRHGELRADGVRYKYIARPEHIRGFHGVKVNYMGTYYLRKDIDEIRALARRAELP